MSREAPATLEQLVPDAASGRSQVSTALHYSIELGIVVKVDKY